MLAGLDLVLGWFRAVCRSHSDLALENLALRQQLAVLSRRQSRPRLTSGDRWFWIVLYRTWTRWTDALIVVKPATVVAWHRAGSSAIGISARGTTEGLAGRGSVATPAMSSSRWHGRIRRGVRRGFMASCRSGEASDPGNVLAGFARPVLVVARHRFPAHAGLPFNPAITPAELEKGENSRFFRHLQVIGHSHPQRGSLSGCLKSPF
jgi:hypothetical protein